MLFIGGQWRTGGGAGWQASSPVDGARTWQGQSASAADVGQAVAAARSALAGWMSVPVQVRRDAVQRFAGELTAAKADLAQCISAETGKPLWESRAEVAAMIAKVAISIEAQDQRAGERWAESGAFQEHLTHRALGVMVVLGPYNFPGHLPNGHIVPALLAGNTVVFKPSELTPATAELTTRLWERSGLPAGVFNLLQGAGETGRALAGAAVDGILFTGSAHTGRQLHAELGGRPEVMLALEMGGNNPLIVAPGAEIAAAVSLILPSAFLSAGQRCTCARRLLLPQGADGDALLTALEQAVRNLRIDGPDAQPEPFMGPLISAAAADALLAAEARLLDVGGRSLLPLTRLPRGAAWLSPGLIDVSAVAALEDREYFGPLLCIQRYRDFEHGLALAGATRFGLAAGLIGGDAEQFQRLREQLRVGILNWNRPLTGASSKLPFGGLGSSGNHRASALYAADYCAHPVASLESAELIAAAPMPGMVG